MLGCLRQGARMRPLCHGKKFGTVAPGQPVGQPLRGQVGLALHPGGARVAQVTGIGGLVIAGRVGQRLHFRFVVPQQPITGEQDVTITGIGTFPGEPVADESLFLGVFVFTAGFNFGFGVGFPLTDFSALAEARLHVVLADGKPILALPLSVGVRF